MKETPPTGFDILVLEIIDGHWQILPDVIDKMWNKIIEMNGSVPTMRTICDKMDWVEHDEVRFVVWDEPQVGSGKLHAKNVVAVVKLPLKQTP